MIGPPANTRIWVAAGFTDMRCGFDGLAAKVQTVLAKNPFSGHIFVSARFSTLRLETCAKVDVSGRSSS
ncbi:IS66 family insertion sequence element accessory protein TnpB, partial [Paraburkholderia sp. SIMBA_055]